MYVSRLEVTNYRNYSKQAVELSPAINIFVGENAQGKTNLLEAIYLCSVGKSPRTPRDKELIKWGESRSKISVDTVNKYGTDRVDIILDKQENKRVAINQMPVSKMGELMGVVSTVFFSPGELKIVQNSPGERRSFMDIAICQISKTYFYLLSTFNKVLAQRNKLLKSKKIDHNILDVWDIQLAQVAAKVSKTRKGFVENLQVHAEKNHSIITDNKEKLVLEYDGLIADTYDIAYEEYIQEFKKFREKDLFYGYTHIGPHKDDIKIKVNDIDIRSYGSQGQQRSVALSLKLAELDINQEKRGEYPILLLDDVFSELDLKRQEMLLNRISDFQTIITCTHLEERLINRIKNYTSFKVSSGEIV